MLKGESLHSALPWDIPWWMPDHTIFFGVLYMVLGILGLTVTIVLIKSYFDTISKPDPGGHH